MTKYSSFCNALSSTQYWLPMCSTSFAVLLSALPHCRIFSKSTATRKWLTCVLDILQFRKKIFKNKKPRWNRETKVLNGHTKRQRPQREKLPVKARHYGRFYTKDALSVWTNLGKHFVVRLGYASLV